MKSRGVVGKRIVRIQQARIWNDNSGSWVVDVQAIVLEDGTCLVPVTAELEADYATEMIVVSPRRPIP